MNLESGMKIAHLKLIEEIYKCDEHRKRKYWKCKCITCGKEFVAREDLIKSGQQISCGCWRKMYRHNYLKRNVAMCNNKKGGKRNAD